MKWVTRAHVDVDRVACSWLIKRYIDADAEFYFVAKEHVLETAKKEQAIPFDIEGSELEDKDDSCTFTAFLCKYELLDSGLTNLGDLMNAYCLPERYSHPFVSCLDAVSKGFSLLFPDDLENIEQQFCFFDALYTFYKIQTKEATKTLPIKKKEESNLLFTFSQETKNKS